MSQNSCCVPGCQTTKKDCIPLHWFPNPEQHAEKFKTWIMNIGGEITTLDNRTIYVNRRVCHKHFEEIHKYPKNRLSSLAVPVLHMSGESLMAGDTPPSIPSTSNVQQAQICDAPMLESGSGGEPQYTTKWYAYKEMDGLMARTKKRRVNTFWMQEAKSGDEESSDSPPQVILQPSATKVQHNGHKNADSDAQTTSIYNKAIETLKAIRETKSEATNDELTNYGMYIASHLRKFSPPMQARAKFEINKILYALDMESMNEGTTTIMNVDDNGAVTVEKECKIDPLYKD